MNRLTSLRRTPILAAAPLALALCLLPPPHAANAALLVPGASICLQDTANGKYVCADNFGANPLVANRSTAAAWESFTVLDAGGGNIALRSQINGEYVCADNAGASPLIANRTAFGPWETFTEINAGGGHIALRAMANSKYVSANNSSNNLVASSTSIGSWESFSVQTMPVTVSPKVYYGTMHGWQDLLNSPSQWTYVRANVDGFYANFIQLLPTVGNPGAMCSQLAPLMTHKNAYFESDSRYTGLGGFPNGGQYTLSTEAQEMNELLNAGFNITYTSLNYGVDNDKLSQCRTLGLPSGAIRPCLAQNGPWLFGGDINQNVQNNPSIRNDIGRTEGQSTDGPMDLWVSNNGQMQQGSVSVVKYARNLGKLSMVMVSPGDLPAAQWLSAAQQCIRYHENQGATPEIWADYAYDTQTPTLPESNSDGSAANTTTGVAYWLIHHVTDPAHWARLTLPNTRGLRTCSAPTTLSASARAQMAATGTTPLERTEADLYVPTTRLANGRRAATRVIDLTLRNESQWLDLSPVLRAEIDDPGRQWTVGFRMGGKDITEAVAEKDGFAFLKDQRLWPSASKKLQLVLTCANPAKAHPVTVRIGLLANPSRPDKLNEMLTIHGSTTNNAAAMASAAIAHP
ncbi:hypothetical protein CCAX7_15390 [Capsulimonas corticalis]|uniref:Uncharacterized protein n=1 Tax=Capsulimonas corticalis TaxID=2219043 RepID=A0A402CZA5_9BACT|nr:hypothetical protein [Capsulimonas corticalis]BDI29488.1 hypothetical protein CCAX7_15390 [Capsulimonas corticalis]